MTRHCIMQELIPPALLFQNGPIKITWQGNSVCSLKSLIPYLNGVVSKIVISAVIIYTISYRFVKIVMFVICQIKYCINNKIFYNNIRYIYQTISNKMNSYTLQTKSQSQCYWANLMCALIVFVNCFLTCWLTWFIRCGFLFKCKVKVAALDDSHCQILTQSDQVQVCPPSRRCKDNTVTVRAAAECHFVMSLKKKVKKKRHN